MASRLFLIERKCRSGLRREPLVLSLSKHVLSTVEGYEQAP